jgi:hypothetical protein
VDVNVAHVNPEFTRHFEQHSDPPIQGVGGEVVLGGTHRVVAPRVLEQQAVPMLKGLDPLSEPGNREVLPRQALLR